MEISYNTALYRSAITIIAPAVMLTSFIYHPHVGNPIDADFLEKLEFRTGKEMWEWVTNSPQFSQIILIVFIILLINSEWYEKIVLS